MRTALKPSETTIVKVADGDRTQPSYLALLWDPAKDWMTDLMSRLLDYPTFTYPSYSSSFSMDEEDNQYILRISVPGFKRDEIEVEISSAGSLSVRARRREKGRVVLLERAVSLGSGANAGGAAGRLEDGVLTITVPKQDPVPPIKVPVI